MLEIFQHDFMLRAFAAGCLVAIVLPVMGNFLIARRYSLIIDSLSHASLAGIAAGLLSGVAPVAIAIPIAIIGALALEWLRQTRRVSGDVGLAIIMSSGLAIAIVLAGLAKSATGDFDSYLFGSIVTTTTQDVILIAIVALTVLGMVVFNYRALLYIAFDEDSARIAGYRVTLLNYALAAMTALIVVLSLRIVGGLLMSALLVMPVIAASQCTRSFRSTIILSVVFGIAAVITGLSVAFYGGVPAGGAIVLSALTILILASLFKKE